MKLATVFAVAALTASIGATAVLAQEDVLTTRKAFMKGNSAQGAIIARMTKGEAPYDAALVTTALNQWADTATKFPALFPVSSQEGDTRALPAIWTERAKFEAAATAFGKDIADNRAKATANLDGLKVAMGAIGKHCGSCHEAFRKPAAR